MKQSSSVGCKQLLSRFSLILNITNSGFKVNDFVGLFVINFVDKPKILKIFSSMVNHLQGNII